MKHLIVGAGVSGIAKAINIKRHFPNDDVLVIEHLKEPLKKLLATGNGRCNLGNANLDLEKYNHPDFAKKIKTLDNKTLNEFYKSIHVETKIIDGLIYPNSESAVTIKTALLRECSNLGVKINVEESLIDYKIIDNEIGVITTKNKYVVDKLYFATGLKSSPKLGSDGSLLSILNDHGYTIKDIKPGLCPIFVKENLKVLDGVRVKGTVSLFKGNKLVWKEDGEILFKKNALSGIVIMNASSIIARDLKENYIVSLDIINKFEDDYLRKSLKQNGKEVFLSSLFNGKVVEYIAKIKTNDLIKLLRNIEFHFVSLFDYEFSQVSIGGISIDEINSNLESKKEKNVFFLGELIDIDGPCGGYNLSWAFASALI